MNPGTKALLSAPLLLTLYGTVRLVPGSRQPGPGWTIGHLALFAGLLLLGIGLAEVHRRIRPRTAVGRTAAGAGLGATVLGVACSLGQAGIDLYVGAAAADKAEQHAMFDRIQSHAGVVPAFYSAGPLLLYVGLLALAVGAAVVRRLPWWSPVLVFLASALPAVTLDLLPVGGLLYLAAFAPLARPAGRVSASGTPARAA
ncbi:hypothetical protein [Kitasatospora terrestris]|uniref:DUF4386 domain-containing protein n=1 Tax=Kitasatospora terrestris TaxID=258051 RepID=A0ABP9DPK9_9ACTN